MDCTIPQGFKLSVTEAGFKYKDRPDLALILSDTPAVCAAFFTTNLFQAAPVKAAGKNLEQSSGIRAILVNAGQANACTGSTGMDNCLKTLRMLADLVRVEPMEIIPASTGVIGDQLKMELFEKALPGLVENLGLSTGEDAARAIMTTDTFPKTASCEAELGSGRIRFFGMAKGSGMICPNMATMLAFILTDLKIDQPLWKKIMADAVDKSFNALTIDGDTSTNDCVVALASGQSEVEIQNDQDLEKIAKAVKKICAELSYQIVSDAEGGTRVLRIEIKGAKDKTQARMAADAVGNSPLVKTAMYGGDPNWGRIVAALGRSRAEFDPDRITVTLAGVKIFCAGQPVDMDRDKVFKPLLQKPDIDIKVDLGAGEGCHTLLASDLTEEYIRINAHYRT
ncbi:MAG: bifunctional glutamate N-acetyltransferase/amino-acid acetyltransferase ArgJ [Desulfonatronovibrio sp.]